MATEFSVKQLVNDTVRQFEAEFGFAVSPAAVALLVSRGEPHQDQIKADLNSGHATLTFLHGILREILRRAESIAKAEGHTEVTEVAVDLALKEDCPYLGWC